MIEKKYSNCNIKEKGDLNMAVSMAVIPTLQGPAAVSVLETLGTSKIKPYSTVEKKETEKRLIELLQERENRRK